VCKLSSTGGHWLIDLDENERPRVEDLWPVSAADSVNAAESANIAESVNATEKRRMQAVKPSYANRRPLKLTAEDVTVQAVRESCYA
jgi:hypothetical protein